MKQIASFVALAAIVLVVGFTHTISAQETEVVEIKKGEVLRVLNNTVVVRVEGEGVKTFVVPYDFKFNHEGQEITVRDLRAGHQLTSVRFRTTGPARDVAEEDIDEVAAEGGEAPADVAEVVTEAAEAVTEAAGEMVGSMDSEAESAAESVEDAAESAAETAEAAAAETGMSPGLMIGLLLLALVLVVLAVKQLRKA